MATDNYYFERNDHDTSIDSLPSILSERPSHNTLQDLINYNISPKLFNGSDLTYGIEKSVHESREFVRKSANRNFKPPQIDRNSMLSPGRKEFVVEINDQNAFLQPDSKKFMNKKIIKGIKSSKIAGNLAPEVTTKVSQQKPKTPNKTSSFQKSKTGFQPTNWTSPNMKKLPPNPSAYTIMEGSQAPPEKLNRKSIKSRNTPVPETIYESNLYPSTSTLGEDKPEPKEVFEKSPSIADDFAEDEESQDHPIPENVKPPSPSESMIYKKPKRYGSDAAHKEKLNLSINLEEEEEEEAEKNFTPQASNKPQAALGNKEKLVRPFLGVLAQKLITDDSMMDPPTTPNRTRNLRDYSSFMHGESSIDILGTNRESNFGGTNNKLDNTVYLSPRSDGGHRENFCLPQENRPPSSPQSSNDDVSFVSCLSYDPNAPSGTEFAQNNSFKKIEVQVSKETTNDKDFIKSLLHNIEKENKNPPKNAKTEYRYATTTKAKDQPYLTQLNSQTFKKSLDINKNREAMLKNSYKILKDLDTVWFHSEAERDEMIYKTQQPQTTKQAKQTKVPPMKRKPEFDDNEQEFRHPCSPKISPKEKSKKLEPSAVYTERSLTDIVLSNDFQPKIVKNVNLSISALKINESSQDLSREYANKTDFSISQSMIPCENDEYSYESVDTKVKGLNAQPPHMGKKSHPQKVLSVIEKTENITQKAPESTDMFDEYESFSNNDIQDSQNYGEHDNSMPNNDEIVEPSPMRYRVTLMDQSQLPIIDEVSSTHMLTASYVDNQPSLAQKNNLTNISIHSDYCLTEPDPNFSRILTELPQDLICGGSLDNLDLLSYENVQNSSDSNRIISDSIREVNNYSADEKQKTIGNLLEGFKPELSSLNMNLIKTKSSGTTPQASSQRRKLKKPKYDENNKKRNASGSDFTSKAQKEKSLPKKMEKENKFYEMGYDNISREVLMQTKENCLMTRLDKNTEFNANGINAMKTSKQTQSISITTSKAPLKLPKSTNSLTAIPIAKKKPLVDKENQERREASRTFLRRPDLTKEPLQAKILNSYTKKSTELGYKDENLLLSSRNSSLSEIDPLVSNEVLKGQAMCYAGLLNNYNFLDNDKIDVSRKHHK